MRRSMICVLSALALCVLGGCSKSESGAEQTSVEANKPTVEKIQGEAFANKYFKATVPTGWKVTTDPKMDFISRIHKTDDGSGMGPSVHIKIEGHGAWPGEPKAETESMAKSQSGTNVEQVSMAGQTFFKTTFGTGMMKQTMFMAKNKGNKVTVTLMGTNFESEPMLMKIFGNLEFL